MSEESKVTLVLLSLLVAILATTVGGCTASTWSAYNHKERMAALGYQEVVESVVGQATPVRYWRKPQQSPER